MSHRTLQPRFNTCSRENDKGTQSFALSTPPDQGAVALEDYCTPPIVDNNNALRQSNLLQTPLAPLPRWNQQQQSATVDDGGMLPVTLLLPIILPDDGRRTIPLRPRRSSRAFRPDGMNAFVSIAMPQ